MAVPGGTAELVAVAAHPHLMRLTFPAGATGFLVVDVDNAPLPGIDLAEVAVADTQVLVAIQDHAERSIGLSYRAA